MVFLQKLEAHLGFPLNLKNSFISCCVLLFPGLIPVVEHSGGVIFILLTLAGLIFSLDERKNLEPWEKHIFLGFLIFFLVCLLSLINTQDMDAGMQRVEKLLHFPFAFFAYLFIRSARIDLTRVFIYGLCLGAVILFVSSAYDVFVLNIGRARGAYYSILLGDQAVMVAVLLLATALLFFKKTKQQFISMGFVLLAMLASLLAAGKGGWLFLPVALFFLVAVIVYLKTYRSLFVLGGGLLAVFSIWMLALLLNIGVVKNSTELVVNMITNPAAGEARTLTVRQSLWRHAITIWKVHPIIGTGLGDFFRDNRELVSASDGYSKERFGHAHNIYLNALATTGILGFASLVVGVFIYPVNAMLRSNSYALKQSLSSFVFCSSVLVIVGFAIFGMTEGWLDRNPFVRIYLLFLLVLFSIFAVKQTRQATSVKN
ncbi:MAG: O-antigen ligase family protein [Gammaproteobacteria bacterium]|nr:O-antigen ligase family protein [Gammaproteobacteria bacterium]